MILLIKTTHSVENKEKYVILMLFGDQCDLYIHGVHQYSTFHKSKEKMCTMVKLSKRTLNCHYTL